MEIDRLSPDQRVKQQKVAYDKTLNLVPAQKQRFAEETGRLRDTAVDEVAKQAKQGGYQGRVSSGQVVGQAAKEVAGLAAQQQSQQDQLTFQGAQQKEDIIATRQQAASSDFMRKAKQQEAALAEVIAQRAFDLGMQSKELVFHNNSVVADAGFQALQRDFEAGRVDRREIQNLARNEAIEAKKLQLYAERMLSKRWGELEILLQKGNISEAKKRLEVALEYQKQAAKRAARASALGGIISGVATIGATAVAGPAAGAVAGTLAGSVLGMIT